MDWSEEEEDQMRQEALDLAKKKELAWAESHGGSVADVIKDVEAGLQRLEREIQVVTALQVDEVRQSLGVLGVMDDDSQALADSFDGLGKVLQSEREDIKGFMQLREVHYARERISAVCTTASTLLSLQQRHLELSEAIADDAPLGPVCAELLAVQEFRCDLELQQRQGSSPGGAFSTHFELLSSVLRDVVRKVRETFLLFAERGDDVNVAEAEERDWAGLLDAEVARLADAVGGVLLHAEHGAMLAYDPQLFEPDERADVAASAASAAAAATAAAAAAADGGGGDAAEASPLAAAQGVYQVMLRQLRRGVGKLWVERYLGTHQLGSEGDYVASNPVEVVLGRMTEWTKCVDALVYNFVKDGDETPSAGKLAEGVWRSQERAQEAARCLIDAGHEQVTKILDQYRSRMNNPLTKLSPPEALLIIKWSRVYSSMQGILSTCEGLGFGELPTELQPVVMTQEGKMELAAKVSLLLRHTAQNLKEWLAETAKNQGRIHSELLYSSADAVYLHPSTGKLGSMASVDFLDLVSTQINEISAFKDQHTLDSLVSGIQIAAHAFCETLTNSCRPVFLSTLREGAHGTHKASERLLDDAEHRLRVMCAVANDLARCEDELPDIETRFRAVVAAEKHAFLSFDMARGVFQEGQALALHGAAGEVMGACDESWEEMFARPEAVDREGGAVLPHLHDVLETVGDFCADLSSWLRPPHYTEVVALLARQVETQYLQGFAQHVAPPEKQKKGAPELRGGGGRHIRLDADAIRARFAALDDGTRVSQALPLVAGLVEAGTASAFSAATDALFASFPDCPSGLGPQIAARRVDLTDQVRERCVEAWNSRVAEQSRNEHDLPAGMAPTSSKRTLMSYVSARAQTGGRVTAALGLVGKLLKRGHGAAGGGVGGSGKRRHAGEASGVSNGGGSKNPTPAASPMYPKPLPTPDMDAPFEPPPVKVGDLASFLD